MSGSLYARALTTDPETGMTAEDWAPVRQGLTDWAHAQQQKSYDMGLADPATGWPTRAGVAALGPAYANALLMGTTAPGEAPGITAYHGSPHSFDRFDIGKIGTGEGAQAYGHGLYFAENEGVARSYRDALTRERGPQSYWTDANGNKLDVDALRGGSGPQSEAASMLHQRGSVDEAIADVKSYGPDAFSGGQPQMDRTLTQLQKWKDAGLTKQTDRGSMYEVNINADPEHFLHWDKPLSEQSQQVQDALGKLGIKPHDYTVRQSGDGYVVDYGGKTSRTFPTQEAAQLAADETAKIQGLNPSGNLVWQNISNPPYGAKGYGVNDPAAAAQALREAGIPGIRYYDAGSRGAGEGSHNYVVFDPATLDILRKYGIAGLGIGGAATMGVGGNQDQQQ